jgi:predicted RecB family nuclease
MVDLTELNGVGPARSGYLEEAGYEDFETIADADNEQLAEDVDIPEDTALELIVQSQNIVAEQEAEVTSSGSQPTTISEELDEELEEEVEDLEEEVEDLEEEVEEEVEEEAEPEDDGPITFEIEFEQSLSYDTFFDSVMQQRMTMYQTNRTGVEAFNYALGQMRNNTVDEPVTLELTEDQLNDLHNSVRQKIIDYKGNNLIDHMDALKQIMTQIEEVRSEHLF